MRNLLAILLLFASSSINAVDLNDALNVLDDVVKEIDKIDNESQESTGENTDGMCVYDGEFIQRELRTPFEGYSCDDMQKEWKRIDLPLSNSPYKVNMQFLRTFSMDNGGDIEIRCTYNNISKDISGSPVEVAKLCGSYIEKTKKEITEQKKIEHTKLQQEKEAKAKKNNIYQEQLTKIKSKRTDGTGKFGLNFKMNHTDAVNLCKGTKYEMAPLNFVCNISGKTINLTFSKLLNENGPWPEAFINTISLSIGLYTDDDFERYYDKLDDKYDDLYEPSKGNIENFRKGYTSITYYFENDSDNSSPRYIGLHLVPAGSGNAFMYIQYFEENYFIDTVINAKENKENELDDL